MEFLIHLVYLSRLHLIVDFTDYLIEIGWSVQISVLQSFLIMTDHFSDSVYSWVEDVSVECEAVGSSRRVGRNCPAEAVQIYHLVAIVELQNITDSADGVKILVAVWVKVVKGVCVTRITVRKCKIYCKCQVNLAATKYILQK